MTVVRWETDGEMRWGLNTFDSSSARISAFSSSEDANELSGLRRGRGESSICKIDFVLRQRDKFVSERFLMWLLYKFGFVSFK